MMKIKALIFALVILIPSISFAADSNTVSSTVVTGNPPPTASAPSIVINNSDVCKSAASAAIQTQILGFASGITITDENCERIKLARGLYGMGMKVAAVSMLCQDVRVFDAMLMAGTPCPYRGKIGSDAQEAWDNNLDDVPENSIIFKKKSDSAGVQREQLDESTEGYFTDNEYAWINGVGIVVGIAGLAFGSPLFFF